MSRTKSVNPKQSNFSYQSLYLWTSFLLGMISLEIILWNHKSVIPPQAGMRSSFLDLEFLDSRLRGNDNGFTSSLVLSALTYQQTHNSFASLFTLTWPTLISATQFDKRQIGGNEFRVNTYTRGRQTYPRVKKLSNDEFIIAWNSAWQDGSDWGVFAQRYAYNGTRLGKEFQVNNFTQGDQSQPWIEALNPDSFVVTWHYFKDANHFDIYARLYRNNGTALNNEFLVNMSSMGYPSVFANTADEFLILWNGQDNSSYGVFGRYYFNNGTASSLLFQVNDYMDGDQSGPSAAALSNNTWIIAWHSNGQDGSFTGLYAKIFINHTNTLSEEFRINQYTQNYQVNPIIIHFDEEFGVIFLSQGHEAIDSATNYAVYGRRFSDNGTALSDEFRISFRTLSPFHSPSATVLNNDYFIVVWKADTNITAQFDVYGRICHREGNCISPEFRINSQPSYGEFTGEQIAILTNESFVIAYEIIGGDLDGSDGVYARIINLSDLNITLPRSISRPTSVSESITSSSTSETNSQLSFSNSNSVTINKNTTLSSGNNSNVGAYAGVAVAGVVVLGGLLTAGFFVCRRKSRENKVQDDGLEKQAGTELQNKDNTISTSQNYARIDEIKKPENQYDNAPKVEI